MSEFVCGERLQRWAPNLLLANGVVTLGVVQLRTTGVASVIHVLGMLALLLLSGLLIGLLVAPQE